MVTIFAVCVGIGLLVGLAACGLLCLIERDMEHDAHD